MNTREDIMTAARSAVEKDGYCALSFRDLAAEVGVKSSSVHHHFPTKGDLAEALITRYREDLLSILESLGDKTPDEALDGYIAVFRSFFDSGNQMCLVWMMSAEVTALPSGACAQIKHFMKAHTDWIQDILAKKHARLSAAKRTIRAEAIFAAVAGAQLIARGHGGDPAVFDKIINAYRATGLLG